VVELGLLDGGVGELLLFSRRYRSASPTRRVGDGPNRTAAPPPDATIATVTRPASRERDSCVKLIQLGTKTRAPLLVTDSAVGNGAAVSRSALRALQRRTMTVMIAVRSASPRTGHHATMLKPVVVGAERIFSPT